ncbi:Conserved hypothetical protein [Herminiimonas arsenicoxydans]|uniref:Transposase IS200-like domain-containing protein n=1 Tax=Herminiimonas arsenicoxydans TaxID=204773 RepID=A4G9K5_HERAR|nr:Conserved hypothetical protein [Herminiimonas arsenicoxydans]
MARLPRLVIPNQAHHVIQSGNNGQVVFRESADYRFFLSCLKEAAKQFKVAIHAYVLMPTHFHLLATPTDLEGLSRLMQWLGRHYVPYFNRKYARTGTLWQGRYKATVLDAERYFMTCCAYIELNPVRCELAHAADYPWSSYAHHIGINSDPIISDHPLYWSLGNTPFEREAAYRALVEQGVKEDDVRMLTEATLKGWALGSEQFQISLEKQGARRVRPAKRGRPVRKALEFAPK